MKLKDSTIAKYIEMAKAALAGSVSISAMISGHVFSIAILGAARLPVGRAIPR